MEQTGGGVHRGGSIADQKKWADGIHIEEACRMKWFLANEERLQELVDTRENEEDEVEEAESNAKKKIIETIQHQKRYTVKPTVTEEPEREKPPILDIMRPVDAETKRLLYTATQKDGRVNYLNARNHLYPEDKFYYPETSNFRYGWKTWDIFKNLKSTGFGSKQVIKASFYRRRAGINPDPEWYKEPSKVSPTVCSCK